MTCPSQQYKEEMETIEMRKKFKSDDLTKASYRRNIKKKCHSTVHSLVARKKNVDSTAKYSFYEPHVEDTHDDGDTLFNTENRTNVLENQEENLDEENIPDNDNMVYSYEEACSSEDSLNEECDAEVNLYEEGCSLEDSFNEECEVEAVLASESSACDDTLSIQAKQNVHSNISVRLNNQGNIPVKRKRMSTQSETEAAKLMNKRPRTNDKIVDLPVPSHINQYGDCLKTRLGKFHYGLTLTDPPGNFFQGVLKGATGQTLAVMFGDVNLIAKFESVPLEDIGNFAIDTSFNISPIGTEGVNKVFTISLIHQNLVIPLWYAMTTCSSTELYKRILIEFHQHVLDWPFTSVLMNNDPALCKAIQTVFPDVEIYGSWFYYCYSIWKEVNLNNLTEKCKVENSTLLMAVKLLMVMPYMPPPSVENSSSVSMVDGFQYVRIYASENNLPEGFDNVLDYVASFWFEKVTAENFTVFGKHTDTLNYAETLQLLLLSYMKENANVWELTRSFQSVAKSTYGEFIRSLNGKRLNSKKNRGKRFNAPICQNVKKLMGGTLDVKTFLERSTIYLEEILDIFLHPVYLTSSNEDTSYTYSEGWKVRICCN